MYGTTDFCLAMKLAGQISQNIVAKVKFSKYHCKDPILKISARY